MSTGFRSLNLFPGGGERRFSEPVSAATEGTMRSGHDASEIKAPSMRSQ